MRPLTLLALSLLPGAAGATSPLAYAKAVTDIRELYLYPEQVDAPGLLRDAALGAAEEVEWLLVDASDGAVHLRHGDGTAIGSVSVANLDTLPAALETLEELVGGAGFDVGAVDVRLALLEGLTDGLDRYSRILAGDRLDRFEVRLNGTLVGIGVTFRVVDDLPRITELVDGPARAAGLQVDDVILRVDGVSTLNMPRDEISRRIRGAEGTEVVLGLRRGEAELDVSITRAEVQVPNVHHEVLADAVGYVKIDHFSQRTVDQLRASLAALRDAGALSRGLVIDLRGNTGGSMKEAARSADQFLTEGLLLRTAGRDGLPVDNLQGEMLAVDAGDEPEVPVVVLMDRQTASGSEILAGALLAHHRAGLVGTRSFGKGTVQKIYRLDADTRLKLTVARFLLEGDLPVADVGIPPDVAVGDVILDRSGARYRGWREEESGAPWEQIVPAVQEREGWRGEAHPARDVALELARRAVLRAEGWEREPTVAALRAVAAEVRAEEEGILAEALAGREIDWSPAPAPVSPEVGVRLSAAPDPDAADTTRLTAVVENRGDTPLHRVLVELDCESFGYWDGVVVPVGLVPAGARATGSVSIALRPGIAPREDVVRTSVRADGAPPVATEERVLTTRSTPVPPLAVYATLAGEGPERTAQLRMHNPGEAPVHDVTVFFAAPGDGSIALVDAEAAIPVIAGRGAATARLGLRLGPDAPDPLPLSLVVEAGRFQRVIEWPLNLPTDGAELALAAPTLHADASLSAPVGRHRLAIRAADEEAVDHVVLYADGHKVAWAPGGGTEATLSAEVTLAPGSNAFVAVAEDSDGLRTRLAFAVRGEPAAAPASVDAGE